MTEEKINLEINAESHIREYYKRINSRIQEQIALAKTARAKNFDVHDDIETVPALDMADRTEKIIGPPGIAAQYHSAIKLSKGDRNAAIFQLFREMIEQKWYTEKDRSKRLEQAVKSCLMLVTEGVVVAPLDGVPKVCISKNLDGSEYVDIYFAGPIRAAGGTATVFPLILGDYARTLMKLDRYKPTDSEVERYVEEVQLYDEIQGTRQYKLTPDEIRLIIKNCPVCVNGEPTEEREVVANKDLERIPTNRVRGGACLVISEGVALKAMKIMKESRKLGLDWSWLEKIIKVSKAGDKESSTPSAKYLSKIAAGRPIFCYPSRIGGFRLRYGRARNSGIMAKAMHPATMHLLDEFIAIGTQLKVERPGKSAGMFPCNTIEGPIVKLSDGEVIKVNSVEQMLQLKPHVSEILFLGDYLVSYGDFRHSGHQLMPAGYCEEWWALELQKAVEGKGNANFDFNSIAKNPKNIDCFTAVELSMQFGIPLHPEFTHYYNALSIDEAKYLASEARNAEKSFEGSQIVSAIFENSLEMKKILEKIGIPHNIDENKIIIGKDYAYPFLKTVGALGSAKILDDENACELFTKLSGMQIRDKCGTFIGARMGRPEQAKPREMKGHPHVLFPVGLYGGTIRSINKAAESMNKGKSKGSYDVEASIYKCHNCGKEVPFSFCPYCGSSTSPLKHCKKCNENFPANLSSCPKCRGTLSEFSTSTINLSELLQLSADNLRIKLPDVVKGVKGMISETKAPEPLEKGILRAYHDVHVFRDATIRYEMLNAPLTHFKPKEIGISVEKARNLGYLKDIHGKELTDPNQTLELYLQDTIINEHAGEFFVRVTKFVDDLLERFYKIPAYYKIDTKEQLIGELVLSLAPHTSAALVNRVIGYTKARVNFSHPFAHLARRRNCLLPETPVMVEINGKLSIVKIGDLDNGSKNDEIPLKNIQAYTITGSGKLKLEKVDALLKQTARNNVFKIKTGYGREISATSDHKLLCLDGKGKIAPRKVSDLKIADSLLSLSGPPRTKTVAEINVLGWYLQNATSQDKKKLRIHNLKQKLSTDLKKYGGCWKLAKAINYRYNPDQPYNGGKAIHTAVDFDAVPLDLFEKILREFNYSLADFRGCEISYNKQKSRIPAIMPLDRKLGEVIGYYLADGYARTSDDGKRAKYVYQVNFVSAENCITDRIRKNILNCFGREITVERKSNLDYISLSGRVYYDFFTKILCAGKGARDKRVPTQLLNSTKECTEGAIGGYIAGDGHVDSKAVKLSSVNDLLINDFSYLFARLGIFPHLLHEKEREIRSGVVKEFYDKKGIKKTIKSCGIRIYSTDLFKLKNALFGSKQKKLAKILKIKNFKKKRIEKKGNFVIDKIKSIEKQQYQGHVYDLMVGGSKSFIGGFGNLAIYDCDGEQDSFMLLADALLNFSQHYLPASRGGRMDAPLVFTVAINPNEIDDEAYDMEYASSYPLELYEKAQQMASPELDSVKIVKNVLGTKSQYSGFGFTHDTTAFDEGPKKTKYVQLDSMADKMFAQAQLQSKLRPIDQKDALERVLVSHFLPDIIGNARAFSRQTFRCTTCNTIYRRIPLSGKCNKCSNGNLVLTIAQGSVRKYLDIAKTITQKYHLSAYLTQRIKLIEEEVNSVFANEKVSQKSLFEFV